MDEIREWDYGRFQCYLNLDTDIVTEQAKKIKNNFFNPLATNLLNNDETPLDSEGRFYSSKPVPIFSNDLWNKKLNYNILRHFGSPYKSGSLKNTTHDIIRNQFDSLLQMIPSKKQHLSSTYQLMNDQQFKKILRFGKKFPYNRYLRSFGSIKWNIPEIISFHSLKDLQCDIPRPLLEELISEELQGQIDLDKIILNYGNTIQLIPKDQTLYLAGVNGENTENLVLYKYCENDNSLKVVHSVVNDFQINEVSIEKSNKLVIATRGQYQIQLYKLNSEMKPKTKSALQFDTLTNFCEINPFINNFLTVGCNGNQVHLFDINTNTVVNVFKCGEVRFNWVKAIPTSDPFSMVVLNQDKLTIVDYRGDVNENIEILKSISKLKNEKFSPCISPLVQPNAHSNGNCYHFAVASSHRLHLIDIRQPNLPMLSWNHHLTSTPNNLVCEPSGSSRCLFMSSIYPNQRMCYELIDESHKEIMYSEMLRNNSSPFMMESLDCIFRVDQKLNRQFNPSIYERLHLPIVGVSGSNLYSLKDDKCGLDNTTLFSSNLAGDIFIQHLYLCEDKCDKISAIDCVDKCYTDLWNIYFDQINIVENDEKVSLKKDTNFILQTNLLLLEYEYMRGNSYSNKNKESISSPIVQPIIKQPKELEPLLKKSVFSNYLWNLWNDTDDIHKEPHLTTVNSDNNNNNRMENTSQIINSEINKGTIADELWIPDDWDKSVFDTVPPSNATETIANINLTSENCENDENNNTLDQLDDLFDALNDVNKNNFL